MGSREVDFGGAKLGTALFRAFANGKNTQGVERFACRSREVVYSIQNSIFGFC
jgi:hypothetical protein